MATGCLDTLDLMAKCDNRYDMVSMEYLTLTLKEADLSPETFCESNPRVSRRLLKHLLVFYSESGDFKKLANICELHNVPLSLLLTYCTQYMGPLTLKMRLLAVY